MNERVQRFHCFSAFTFLSSRKSRHVYVCASLLIGGFSPLEFYLEIRVETNRNYRLFKKREVLCRDKLVAYWRNSHIEKLYLCLLT